MFDLLALVIIGTITVAIAGMLKQEIGKVIPVCAMWIIAIEYIFGLFQRLNYGFFLIMGITVVSVIYIVYQRKNIVKFINIRIIGYLFIAFLLFMLQHRLDTINTWDEIAQWAVTVKYSYITDKFAATYGSNAIYPDYPPATAMFHYFWMKVGDNWTDKRLYTSMCMLTVFFFCPFLNDLEKSVNKYGKTLQFIIFSVAISVIPMSIYPTIYCSLTVDAIIAVIFAYMTFTVLNERDSLLKGISLVTGAFVLTGVKKSAILFVVFVLVIWFVQIIYETKREWIIWSGSVFACLLSKITWMLYLSNQGTTKTFSMKPDKSEICDIENWRINGVTNYYKAIIDYNAVGVTSQTTYHVNYFKVPIILMIILIIIGAVYICKIINSNLRIYLLVTLGELCIYILLTSYLYFHSFGEGEVAILSSMNRYLGSFVLAFLLVEIYVISITKANDICKGVGFAGILIILAHINPDYTILDNYNEGVIEKKYNRIDEHNELKKKAEYVKKSVETGARIHIFNGDSAGMNYELTPIAAKPPWWESGELSNFESFHEMYDYVWFDNLYGSIETDEFRSKYGHYFLNKNEMFDGGLYKVVYIKEKPMLQYVDKYNKEGN